MNNREAAIWTNELSHVLTDPDTAYDARQWSEHFAGRPGWDDVSEQEAAQVAALTERKPMTAIQLFKLAEDCDNQADALVERYPGVRPGWVSCEVSILRKNAKDYRTEAKDLS